MSDDDLYKLLGAKIRATRERVRPPVSQAALAKRVGVTRASIVNVECGRQRAPVHVLWRIAEALGSELASLIPRTAELANMAEPLKLSEEDIRKIEAAANGDASTRSHLMRFISQASSSKDELS